MRPTLRLAGLLVAFPACSGADAIDFRAIDASSPSDATMVVMTTDGPGVPVDDATRTESEGGAGAADASLTDDANEADVEASAEAGEDGAADAASEASTLCSRICAGCCDEQGKCRAGTTTTVCGGPGSSCQDCSAHTCGLTQIGCCSSKGTCGCSVAGVFGCN